MLINNLFVCIFMCSVYVNYVSGSTYNDDANEDALLAKLDRLIDEKLFEIQDRIFEKIKIINELQYEIKQEIQELKERNKSQVSAAPPIPAEKLIIESMQEVNNNLVVLQRIPKYIQNNTEQIQSFMNACLSTICKPPSESELSTESVSTTTNNNESADVNKEDKEGDDKDEIDKSIIKKSECSYMSLQIGVGWTWTSENFNKLLNVQFAIRAAENAKVSMWWGSESVIDIFIGVEENNWTHVSVTNPYSLKREETPNILSKDRYVKFYIKTDNTTFTFGKVCDSKPIYETNIMIRKDKTVNFFLEPESNEGVKLLYACPDSYFTDCDDA